MRSAYRTLKIRSLIYSVLRCCGLRFLLFIGLACLSTQLLGSVPLPETLPGIWQEVENGKGNLSIQKIPQASGGRLITQPMKNGHPDLRHTNAMAGLGYLDVAVTGPGLNATKTAGIIRERSANRTAFRWPPLPLGRLDAGALTVSLEEDLARQANSLHVEALNNMLKLIY